jgi:hypothetical protein
LVHRNSTLVQRLLPVAAGSWVQGVWHEAVIGLSGRVAASMTGIVGDAVTQFVKPRVTPANRG